MYSLDTKPDVDKIFSKLSKKDPKQMKIIFRKIKQIVENPYHFKPLKGICMVHEECILTNLLF